MGVTRAKSGSGHTTKYGRKYRCWFYTKLHARTKLNIINEPREHPSITILLEIQVWPSMGKACQIWLNIESAKFGSGDTAKCG